MKRYKPGFTLVELLVVIAIIGILMGLLIPAVGAARESARTTQCGVNVRNLALAAVQHNNTKGILPPYMNKYGFYNATTSPSDPSDPGNIPPSHVKIGGYGVAILPWLDAQPTYEHWTEDRYPIISTGAGELGATAAFAGEGYHSLASPNIGIFQCPSNPVAEGSNGRNSYASNNGMSHVRGASATSAGSLIIGTIIGDVASYPSKDWGYVLSEGKQNGCSTAAYLGADITPFPANPARPIDTARQARLEDLKDGQGFTLLYSENIQAMPWHRAGFLGEEGTTPDLATALAPFDPMAEDLDHTVMMANAQFTAAKFTTGIVWHFEDEKLADAGAVAPTSSDVYAGTTVESVAQQHKINGGGADLAETLFVKTMYDDPTDASNLARPSSAHVDGVNCGFADGSNRFVTENIDYRVYQAMLTPRGKSSDVPWPEFVITDQLD